MQTHEISKNAEMKYIIFLRISDHTPKLTPKQLEMIREKRTAVAKEYGVKWKLAYFLVNKNQYVDYDQAIEAIEEKAIEYMHRLGDKTK